MHSAYEPADGNSPAATPVAVAVVEHQGRFLVGLRSGEVPLGGLWEFPGGKLLPRESPQDAAIRECLEETGIAVTVEQSYLRVVHTYDHGTVELHFFACRPVDASPSPQSPFCWVPREKLQTLPFPEANAQLLAMLSHHRCH